MLGPVFRAYDPQHDRLLAVKSFRLDLVPEQAARLAETLGRLAARVEWPAGIVRPVDAGLEGTVAFLALEYISDETLDVAIRRGVPMPLDAALPILRQIATALDAAWTADPLLGHGALHPRDIFIGGLGSAPGSDALAARSSAEPEPRVVRVTGWGVSRLLEGLGVRVPVRRPYTAPERVDGADLWDRRADVFSLGAIAHELITGRRPAGPGEQDGALLPDTPPVQRVQIRRVLSCALAVAPAQRFDTAAGLVEALEGIAHDAPGVGNLPFVAVNPPSRVDPPVLAQEPFARDAGDQTPAPADETPAASAPLSTRGPAEPPADAVWLAGQAGEPPAFASPELPLGPDGEPAAGGQSYPWSAIAAALIAGLVLGGVGGYQVGRQFAAGRQTSGPAGSAIAVAAGTATTDVTVSPPAVSAPAVPVAPVAAAAPAHEAPPGRAAEPPASRGRVLVRSSPAGASVLLDGRAHGSTPAVILDLPLGAHTIVVSRAGYTPETRHLTLSSHAPAGELTVDLQPLRQAPTVGAVDVDSHPRGARVFIDGHARGKTPLRVPELALGSHRLRLELTGYKSLSTTITIDGGDPAKLAVTLEVMRHAPR